MERLAIDGRVLGCTLLVTILTGIVFGLAPALLASRPDLNETLKDGVRGAKGRVARGYAMGWWWPRSRFRWRCSSAPACLSKASGVCSRSSRASTRGMY